MQMLRRLIRAGSVVAAVALAWTATAGAPHSPLDAGAPRLAPGAWVAVQEPATTPDPPRGAGAEYTEYIAPIHPRNQYLVGGLLACVASLAGALLMLERRRVLGLSICAAGVIAGVFLMLGHAP
jgi:hypothetical protein